MAMHVSMKFVVQLLMLVDQTSVAVVIILTHCVCLLKQHHVAVTIEAPAELQY